MGIRAHRLSSGQGCRWHATALAAGKLCSSRQQQNALPAAIKEYGALRRTVYADGHLADQTYRRRIGRQLNKGENYTRSRGRPPAPGALRRRHHEQMWCLTLVPTRSSPGPRSPTALAVTALLRGERDIDDAVLAHIWPAHHEKVHF
jgi:hypothetical protein